MRILKGDIMKKHKILSLTVIILLLAVCATGCATKTAELDSKEYTVVTERSISVGTKDYLLVDLAKKCLESNNHNKKFARYVNEVFVEDDFVYLCLELYNEDFVNDIAILSVNIKTLTTKLIKYFDRELKNSPEIKFKTLWHKDAMALITIQNDRTLWINLQNGESTFNENLYVQDHTIASKNGFLNYYTHNGNIFKVTSAGELITTYDLQWQKDIKILKEFVDGDIYYAEYSSSTQPSVFLAKNYKTNEICDASGAKAILDEYCSAARLEKYNNAKKHKNYYFTATQGEPNPNTWDETLSITLNNVDTDISYEITSDLIATKSTGFDNLRKANSAKGCLKNYYIDNDFIALYCAETADPMFGIAKMPAVVVLFDFETSTFKTIAYPCWSSKILCIKLT